jgi:glycosyltransferase involved in cell wall biosynthesis
MSYLLEFTYCWLRTALLSVKVARRQRFDVLQACNPPDTYWLLARAWRTLTRRRVKFVFDHHDLNPEVFCSRFGEPTSISSRAQLAGLRWLERRTFRSANHVISTNESYRAIATSRGGVLKERTTVVRSGPDTERMRPIEPDLGLRHGHREMLVYLGIMGPQDGVDIVLRAADVLVHQLGRDVHVALLGFGDSLDSLKRLSHELGLDDRVTFTGRAEPRTISDYLSAADIGLSPDPLNALNDVSTMNKTMEYLSYALPVVAFDLTETRVSAGAAAVYVDPTGEPTKYIDRFAHAIADLLADPDRRAALALAGRRRAERFLDWRPQRDAYVQTFDLVTGHASTPAPQRSTQPKTHDEWGRRHVVVADDHAIRSLVATRTGIRPVDDATDRPDTTSQTA